MESRVQLPGEKTTPWRRRRLQKSAIAQARQEAAPHVEREPQPETASAASELDRMARAHLGTSRAVCSLLDTPVPDVYTYHTPLGRATLAQLLFTDDQQ